MSNTKLHNNIDALFVETTTLDEVKETCTNNEIKEIVKRMTTINVPRKFSDELNLERVKKYVGILSRIEAITLCQYAMTMTSTTKPSPFALITYKKPDHVAISVGINKVAFHKPGEDGIPIPTTGAYVGSITGAAQLVNIASAVCTPSAKVGKGGMKNVAFHVGNELAPNIALQEVFKDLRVNESLVPTELDNALRGITSSKPESLSKLVNFVNLAMPLVSEKKIPVMKLVLTDKGLRSQSSKQQFSRYNLRGEYCNIVRLLDKYLMGTTKPQMQRICRNAWTGTPNDGFLIDHVVALHDAGVQPGQKILVVTPDSNLLALVRANFGRHVLGLGGVSGNFVRTDVAQKINWDWVYHTVPIKVSSTATFELNMLEAHKKFMEMYKYDICGNYIFHMSPLLAYCKEFWPVIGLKVQGENLSKEIPTQAIKIEEPEGHDMYVRPAGVKREPYIGSDFTIPGQYTPQYREYVDGKEVIRGKYVNPMRVLIEEITTFTLALGSELIGAVIPAVLTMISAEGTVCNNSVSEIEYTELLGKCIVQYKHSFRSIWSCSALSNDIYVVRMISSGIVDSLVDVNDEYSGMYEDSCVSELIHGLLVPQVLDRPPLIVNMQHEELYEEIEEPQDNVEVN